jgi:pyridinium-3,5-bisthiocarboxylic acid mononucleotide nickel chelatase
VELHLEIVGKMTGSMFVAVLLDAFPDYEEAVVGAIDSVCDSYPVECRLETRREGGFHGRRFTIEPYTRYFGHLIDAPDKERESWSALRSGLQAASIAEGACRHADSILRLMARHHAAHHDLSIDAVTFPRHDAWQMLAQMVGAAVLIDGLGAAVWTAVASGREFASPVAQGILAHLGALPAIGQPRITRGRSILRSGVGFSAMTGAGASDYAQLNCYDELDAARAARPDGRFEAQGDQHRSGCEG